MTLDLWLDNLLAYSVQIAALGATGTVLPFILKLRHPGVLLRYWQALLAACFLLPAIQSWRPLQVETLALKESGSVHIETTFAAAAQSPISLPIAEILASVLALGIVARLTWLGVGLCRLRFYVRNAQRLHPLSQKLADICANMGVAPQIYLSSDISSPVAFGLWKPLILLPASFLQMSAGFQKAIVCHELWHVRRKDWFFNLLEEMAVALFWFHPAVWWLTSRIQVSREQVVDRLVLKTTDERKTYLEALLQMALARGRPELTFAPLFLTKHHLTQRVALILMEVAMSRTRIVVSLTVLLALLSLTGKLASRAFPLRQGPTAPLQHAQDPSSGSSSSSSVAISTDELSQKLVKKVNPSYPIEAKIQGIQGEVLLAVNVNEKGEVDSVQILKGHPLLVGSAVDTVKQWRYSPYLKDGVAVPVSSTVFVNFVLSGSPKAGQQTPGPATVRLGSNVMAANLESRVEPVYPIEAKEKGIEGEVLFEVTVDEQGQVIDVQVVGGNAILVAAAYDAVRHWRYKPVLLNGNPVRAKANVSVRFELNPKNVAASSLPLAAISQEEHLRRVAYANERFASGGKSGSNTDRGRFYVDWGPPDQIEAHPSGGPGKEDPFEIWRYRRSQTGKPMEEALLVFVGKEYRLESMNRLRK
ncbi:MAG: TonB family protein [Acidobacteria bacterium]|nr:TonB family protein [Acidobacteriota bacterium]MCI0719027.1 TonB family protein [Acidobacteriota bacterium]